MRSGRSTDLDPVARSHHATEHDDAHDPRSPYQFPCVVPVVHVLRQPRLEHIDLGAGVPQAGYGDQRLLSDAQYRADAERMQIDPSRCDILPQISGGHRKASLSEPVQHFTGDEMDLAEIGLTGIGGHPGPVPDLRPGMHVPRHPHAGDQVDLVDRLLGEVMPLAAMKSDHQTHHLMMPGGDLPATDTGPSPSARQSDSKAQGSTPCGRMGRPGYEGFGSVLASSRSKVGAKSWAHWAMSWSSVMPRAVSPVSHPMRRW